MEGARKVIIEARITKVKISLVNQINSYGSSIYLSMRLKSDIHTATMRIAGPYVLKTAFMPMGLAPTARKALQKV